MEPLAHQQSANGQVRSFNYNKLHAVACITSSAAISIGAIYWLIQQVI